MAMATVLGLSVLPVPAEGGRVRMRSPRRMTSAWMTVRPPRMMFGVPWMRERRETLLPVSWEEGEHVGWWGFGAWQSWYRFDVFAFDRSRRHG